MGPTKIGSWVYLFSKFTPEALLFEAFVILGLMALYLAFWVLKKRRMGSVENVVPAGLVKVYLNQLIGEAEVLRTQLFGLLNGVSPAAGQQAALRVMTPDLLSSISSQLPAAGAAPAGAPVSGADKAQLQALETKMTEQAKAMEAIVVEKTRIEKELAAAKVAGSKAGAAPTDDGMVAKLQERIRILEGKLAEYSVIEDDLANLKRLQQENAQLRTALGKPVAEAKTVAETKTEAVAEAKTEAKAETKAEPVAQAAAPAETAAAAEAVTEAAPEAAAAPAAAPAAAAPAEAATEDANFESLVDEVEKSLQEPTPPAPAPAAPTPTPEPTLEATNPNAAAPGSVAPPQEKSDADLVAEFEKMLKG
jgi:hypothetical protein